MLRQLATTQIASLLILAALSFASAQGQSQAKTANGSATWQAEATQRLKAIYERREFRAAPLRANWLADSSGYEIEELDPTSNEPKQVIYDVRTGEQIPGPKPLAVRLNRQPMLSPNGKVQLETKDHNLYLRNLATDLTTQLTQQSAGQEVSYRNPVWSPDGTRVAIVETDTTNVRKRPMLQPDDPSYPSIAYQKFARVGEEIESLRVAVLDVAKQKLVWIPIEQPPEGFYLGQIDWAGNANELLIETLSRFRDKREFLIATVGNLASPIEANPAQVNTIYSETNSAWAESAQGKNSGLVWVKEGKEFIVVTERDGWRHAFLYARDGKEIALLTPGEYDIIDRAVVDDVGGWYYFYASPNNATQKYLYRVPLTGEGKLERISPASQPGTHDYVFSPDAKWAFHTYSTFDTPPVTELVELPVHRVVKVLDDNLMLRAKMKEVLSQPAEFFTLSIGEGVSVDGWLIKPKDFDETKKYPVFVYVYGEPYAQTVLDSWGAAQVDFHRVVADMGYLVVSFDNRGTPAPKGAAWRRTIFGSLGPLSTEDQAAAIQELGRTKSFVDLSRVGIWGWSGGGSNTLNAMFRKPELYHLGIAVVPKPQPHLYNAWFQEIYMRTREVNAEGYAKSAPINFAEGLQGKLLIITGSGETNTHIQIIEGLVDRLIELEKPFDYMVYPNRDHGLREGTGSELHVRMLMIRYLMEHLPSGPH